MTDMDSNRADLRVDLLIDRVAARRRAAGTAWDPAPGRLGPDEALLVELARLGEIDWPADEAGDRIAMSVAAAAGQQAAVPDPVAGDAGSRRAWPRPSRWRWRASSSSPGHRTPPGTCPRLPRRDRRASGRHRRRRSPRPRRRRG